MKNPTFSHAPNFRRKIAMAASAVALGLLSASDAAVIVTLTDQDGVPNEGAGEAGQPFTIRVTLISDVPTTGLTYFLQETTASAGNARFQILNRNIVGTTYSDLTTSNSQIILPANALLDPANDRDLGALVEDVFAPNPPGTYFVADITLQCLPNTPLGLYRIELTPNSVASGGSFEVLQVTAFDYTVSRVPEPTAAGLLMLGALISGARRRSRTT